MTLPIGCWPADRDSDFKAIHSRQRTICQRALGGPNGRSGCQTLPTAGLWAEVGLGGNPKFVQDKGEKLYRRSLYTYWKRSAPPPSMQIFDAPTREKCTVSRARTNTPLQALVTLNDTQFVEAARHFAERLLRQSESDDRMLRRAFRMVTARKPMPNEIVVLQSVLDPSTFQLPSRPRSGEAVASVGESKRSESFDLLNMPLGRSLQAHC